ncbi:MAG: DUF4417 domain-containing protein [Paludibacteraceae bacterium]|nr:DUF4417 domain-containing protein [Paludibacteraceae bacterium]
MIPIETQLTRGNLPQPRRIGCQDVWNASLVQGAEFSPHDIPICPTYLPHGLPKRLISFPRAQTLYNAEMKAGHKDFYCDAFIHFYCDDHLFDGPRNSIWLYPERVFQLLKHFAGIITPDYSTYADFPDPIKRYNTYRMRAFGYACYKEGHSVINNIRWGTDETWSYCYDGAFKGSVVCIGTVASGLRDLDNRNDFNAGFQQMCSVLEPKTILVYGSVKYEAFQLAEKNGIHIMAFPSETNIAYQKGGSS